MENNIDVLNAPIGTMWVKLPDWWIKKKIAQYGSKDKIPTYEMDLMFNHPDTEIFVKNKTKWEKIK